jgi:hypothetical protein
MEIKAYKVNEVKKEAIDQSSILLHMQAILISLTFGEGG